MWRGDKYWSYRDSNSDPSAFQPVASRCRNCAVPALVSSILIEFGGDLFLLLSVSCYFLILHIFQAWIWGQYFIPKLRLTFSGLHRIVSQETVTLRTIFISSSTSPNYFLVFLSFFCSYFLSFQLSSFFFSFSSFVIFSFLSLLPTLYEPMLILFGFPQYSA
jgi:hypothetical protein